MKLKTKFSGLLAALGVAGILASAPAKAELVLSFLDGNDVLIAAYKTAAAGPYTPGVDDSISVAGVFNSWVVSLTGGTTGNVTTGFDYGMQLNAAAFRSATAVNACPASLGGALVFCNTVESANDGILKIRFSDSTFALTPTGQVINFSSSLGVSNGNSYQVTHGNGLGYNASLEVLSPDAKNYDQYNLLAGNPNLIAAGTWNAGNTTNASRGQTLAFGPSTTDPIIIVGGIDFVAPNITDYVVATAKGGSLYSGAEFPTGCEGAAGSLTCPGYASGNHNAFGVTYQISGAVALPEPGTLALLGLSLIGLAAFRRRRAAV